MPKSTVTTEIYANSQGLFNARVIESDNLGQHLIWSTHQGYNNRKDCERICKKTSYGGIVPPIVFLKKYYRLKKNY